MSQGLEFDLKEAVLSNSTFGPLEIQELVAAIAAEPTNYRVLRDATDELAGQVDRSPATTVRLGVCLFLLGRYSRAVTTLKSGDVFPMKRVPYL